MNGEQKPTLLDSQPVAVAGGAVSIVALIMAALLMLNSLGVLSLTEAQLDAIKTFLIPAVAVVGPIISSVWARQKVTPLANPRTKDSEPAVIVPVVQAQQKGLLPESNDD